MKKYNNLIVLIIFIYAISATLIFYTGSIQSEDLDKEYNVEINRIYEGLVKEGNFTKPNLTYYDHVEEVTFLNIVDEDNKKVVEKFYRYKNSTKMIIKPLYSDENLIGYARFDYIEADSRINILIVAQMMLLLITFVILAVIIYVKKSIIKPFNELKDMPYELSKGNLKYDLKENKNKYFGKFVWGINLLRDNLYSYKNEELKLQREKKLLLLSISHDIKTPLSAIKLYAKALQSGMYDTEEQKQDVAKKIGMKTIEIDNFIKEIIKTSSEDILEIDVKKGEFYLKDLIDKIEVTYKERCSLIMTEFTIGNYENKLIKGDVDRAFEVCGNIIENAIKYGDGKSINLTFYEEEYYQLVRIHNTGEIIKSNEFNHIFDSFYRGSNSEGKQGNGLGLYICRQIMKKMDGEVFAECEEDGMNFILVFS